MPESLRLWLVPLCVCSREQLLSTRSITTIGQQTHHVQVHDGGDVQVGTMTLMVADVPLPDTRGQVHVVDCVMCCLRLLVNCRFEQVWNKTVRPSPKVGLQGDWKGNDELHAMLVHCDTWTPRFAGLRGNVVPLGSLGNGADNRAARHFQEGVVHYSELLILEKPPEMSKRKRKKEDDGEAANTTPHYRLMFSLYRRDLNSPPAAAVGEDAAADGKHLTFCMAPEVRAHPLARRGALFSSGPTPVLSALLPSPPPKEIIPYSNPLTTAPRRPSWQDILIRNSFHMLTEGEKEARRNEYKSKQAVPKVRGGAASQSSLGGACSGACEVSHHFDDAAAAAAATAVGMAAAAHGGADGSAAATLRRCAGSSDDVGHWVPPLTIQALKSHSSGGDEHERIVKLEGISPGTARETTLDRTLTLASYTSTLTLNPHPRPSPSTLTLNPHPRPSPSALTLVPHPRPHRRHDWRRDGSPPRRPPPHRALRQDGRAHGREHRVDPGITVQHAHPPVRRRLPRPSPHCRLRRSHHHCHSARPAGHRHG